MRWRNLPILAVVLLIALASMGHTLRVKYDRKLYRHWIDADGDCQDARVEPVVCAVFVATGSAQPPQGTAQPKIRPNVLQHVQDKGLAKVEVRLSIVTVSETRLDPDARLAQRQVITSMQDALIAELAGTRYGVRCRPRCW